MNGDMAGVRDSGARSGAMSEAAVQSDAGYLLRFSAAQRVEHFVTMVDFVGLVEYGVPQ